MKKVLFLLQILPIMVFAEYYYDINEDFDSDVQKPSELVFDTPHTWAKEIAQTPTTTSLSYDELESEDREYDEELYLADYSELQSELTESAQFSILDQLSLDDQQKIRKAVLTYKFAKEKSELKMRPALDKAILLRDEAKLTLVQLLAEDKEDEAYVDSVRFAINRVKEAEQQIVNIHHSVDQNTESLKSELRIRISKIINRWLMQSVKLTDSEISRLLEEANTKYNTLN